MDEDDAEKSQQVAVWYTAYKKGTDFDSWGQPVEASYSYQRLAAHLRLEGAAEATLFFDEQKKILNKIAACLELRSKSLQAPDNIEEITQEDVKRLDSSLKNLLSADSKDFPVEVSSASVQAQLKGGASEITTDGYECGEGTSQASSGRFSFDNGEYENQDDDHRRQGTLLSPLEPVPGKTILTIRIEKIGLKEAAQYIDPFISILVKDFNGVELAQSQDTPVASQKEENYIMFGTDVHIQKPIEMLAYGFAIYFEFKHYKPKKKMYSTKCWSFMEKDEIKEGPVAIELYKKPMDIRRRKIHLLTVKPLFLHLKLLFNV